MIEQTKQLLNYFQWYGALALLDQRLKEASTHGWGHADFLSTVLIDEKLQRDNRRTKRRLRAAHFRTSATLERIDYTADRSLKKTLIRDLMTLNFLKSGQNIFIHGPTGIGKTFLATALGEYICRSGYTCLFQGITILIEKLALSKADGTFLKLRERLSKIDLLIIDDIGLKKLPQDIAVDLHEILEERQEKSTLITTQLPLKNWGEIIEDPLTLDAVADKLKNGTIEVHITGPVTMRKLQNNKPKLDSHCVPVEITPTTI